MANQLELAAADALQERARAVAAEMFAIFIHPAPTVATLDNHMPAILRAEEALTGALLAERAGVPDVAALRSACAAALAWVENMAPTVRRLALRDQLRAALGPSHWRLR